MLILKKRMSMLNGYGSFHTLAKDAVQVQRNIKPLRGRSGVDSKRGGRDDILRSLEYNVIDSKTKQLEL